MSGDGSAAKPWRTLAEVVDPANKLISTQGHAGSAYLKGTDTALHPVNPSAPIKAGDVILLKTGDHGAVTLTNMFNSDFIQVVGAPGAVPVIDKLALVSSSKWLFQGVTFQGMATAATGATTVSASSAGLVTVGRGDWEGTSGDAVFTDDTFETAASTSGWTNYDWINKPYAAGLWTAAPCVSATGNHFLNLLNGLSIGGAQNLVQGNTIEDFSNDAIDHFASYLLIKNNTIRNGVNTTADPFHADGIQGWSAVTGGVTATNTNVVIDGNVLTKTGSSSPGTYMQGITVFDGKWEGLTIQNNVVDTYHWHGITVYGGNNTKILNNTVIAADPVHHASWIQTHSAKDGTAPTNTLVRNNIATQLDMTTGTTFDHNIAAAGITTYPGGKATYASSGTVGTANSVLPAVLGGFMTLDTTNGVFDMRLRQTSPAVGFGLLTGAPALDILGKTRTSPADVGAYNH